jgi:S1-C subfamily serine protease
VAALLLAAVTLAAAGCGSDDSTSTTLPVSSGSGGGPTKRMVVQSEGGAFDPGAVYEHAAPGVVTIRSIFASNGLSLLGGGSGSSAAQGSGFVISDDGEIVTNAHVVTDGNTNGNGPIHEAREVYVQFADRNQVQAKIVGFDPNADVALLQVEPDGLDLQPLQLATGEQITVGQPVAAIGSPFGEEQSLSVGVVSATDRSIPSLTGFQIDAAIQTDASINPGNSGGPLLDADAHVIGINQQINTTSGGNEGVGFAVPIDLVSHSVEQLRQHGRVDYAYLGVTTEPLYPQLADRLGVDSDAGAIVAKVSPGGPAEHAGIRASDQTIHFQGQQVKTGGDVIVAVDGKAITTAADLSELIAQHSPGDEVTVQVIRDGNRQDVNVTLGSRADAPG